MSGCIWVHIPISQKGQKCTSIFHLPQFHNAANGCVAGCIGRIQLNCTVSVVGLCSVDLSLELEEEMKSVLSLARKSALRTSFSPTYAGRCFTSSPIDMGSCSCCGSSPFTCLNKWGQKKDISGIFQQQKKSFTSDSFAEDDLSNADPHVRNLLENNRNWVKKMNTEDPEFFSRLAKGQNPKYLYIGCSDSRVPANQILGLG